MGKLWFILRENAIWIAIAAATLLWFGRGWIWSSNTRHVPELVETSGIDAEIVETVASLVRSCRQSKRNDEDFLRLGMTYHANGLVDLAIQTYTEYLKGKPKSIKPRYLRALCYLKQGEIEQASEDLSECRRLESTFAPIYWRSALLQLDEGKYEEAIELLRTSEMHAPRDLTVPLVRAKALMLKGALEPALAQLEKHDFEQHPNEAYARFLRGSILRQLGREDEARLYLDEHASRPEWTDSWQAELQQYEVGITAERIKASALFRRNMFDACIPMFEKIVEAGRADHRDFGMLASSYLRKGDLSTALRNASQAVEVSPRDFNSWMNLGNMQLLASTRFGPEYLGQALNSVTRASELRPERWEPHDARGQIRQIQARRIEALEAYRTAVSMTRSVEMCEWRLIYLLLEMNRIDEAAERLSAFDPQYQSNPYYLFARAVIAQEGGDSTQALSFLSQIRKEDVKDANLLKKIQAFQLELKSSGTTPSKPQP